MQDQPIDQHEHDSLSTSQEMRDYQDDDAAMPMLEEGGRKGMPADRKRAWDALNELMKNGEPAVEDDVRNECSDERHEAEHPHDALNARDDEASPELKEVDVDQVVIHEPKPMVVATHAVLSNIEEEEDDPADKMSESEEEIEERMQEQEDDDRRKRSLDYNENEKGILDVSEELQNDDEAEERGNVERKIAAKLAQEAMCVWM